MISWHVQYYLLYDSIFNTFIWIFYRKIYRKSRKIYRSLFINNLACLMVIKSDPVGDHLSLFWYLFFKCDLWNYLSSFYVTWFTDIYNYFVLLSDHVLTPGRTLCICYMSYYSFFILFNFSCRYWPILRFFIKVHNYLKRYINFYSK